MLSRPDGYIEIPEAQRRLWLRLHPDEASALQLADGQLHADYAKASEHLDEAGDKLLGALAGEQFGLKGVIFKDGRGFAVDPWYWRRDGARVGTLTNSKMYTLGEPADEWRSWNDLPCFIEEAKFTAWLNLIYPSVVSASQSRIRKSNAFARSFWSYNLLVAWVYLRDPDEVERVADSDVWPLELNLDLRMALRRTRPADGPAPQFENCADAREDIINKLGDRAIVCIGLENGTGDPKEVPARYWSNAKIYVHIGNERVVPYAGPAEPLRSGATTWQDLRFTRELAIEIWQPQSATASAAAASPGQYKTGLPGRPTIAHLILQEFRRRASKAECMLTLAAESRALRDWAAAQHKDAPKPKPRAIENQIRNEYRANQAHMHEIAAGN